MWEASVWFRRWSRRLAFGWSFISRWKRWSRRGFADFFCCLDGQRRGWASAFHPGQRGLVGLPERLETARIFGWIDCL